MHKQQGKVLIFLLLVFLVLGGVVFWYFQKNTYSKDVLKFEVLGPNEIRAGDEIEYTVKYKNNGSARLENPELVFNFPEGAEPVDNEMRVTNILEDIYPGQEENIFFRARLYGKEGELMTARAEISYQPKGLQAFYDSESSFSTRIKETPLTFVFDFPANIALDKETKLSLNYYSNFEGPLSDLAIKIDYPSGFEFQKSRPEGIAKDEWQLGVLNNGDGGRVEVYGKFADGVNQEKIFGAQLGIWIGGRFVALKEMRRGIEISEPDIVISQEINGFANYVGKPGELLHYKIFFRNIGDSYFEDLFLVGELEGPFDFESIRSQQGRINLSDRSIFWDKQDSSKLRFLAAGEEGTLEFWVDVKEDWPAKEFNPALLRSKIRVGQAEEYFETKVSSKLVLGQKAYYEDEVFGNSGPIPPRVGEETTYTIMWDLKNAHNYVENVKIRAVLPERVKFIGKVFPEEEKDRLVFDSESREILWEVEGLEANTGFSSPVKTLAFQVALTPDKAQKGLVATLIGEAIVSGEDQWTEKEIRATAESVDTSLPDDATIDPEKGIIE